MSTTPRQQPELLAPAGNPEKLRVAVAYGADAVYLAGPAFGLRSQAGNFTLPELAEAVAYCHAHGVRVYLTVNVSLHQRQLAELEDYLRALAAIPVDALIVSDPGVLALARQLLPEVPLHLSTQANTLNGAAVDFWAAQGVNRINLARELTLAELTAIRATSPVELEVFVHGALCVAYSGRCLLSAVLTGRSANQGSCAHPCRWRYALVEETRPGEYFPIEEDGGSFIFNSRDLCLLPHLPALLAAGVDSLKIEGRMKGIHYLAAVVRVYRAALDRYASDPAGWACDPAWTEELASLSHRGYTSGFLFGEPAEAGQEYHSRYHRDYDLVGVVQEVAADGSALIGIRNRLAAGEQVELLGPAMRTARFTLPPLQDATDGAAMAVAHPNSLVRCRLPVPAAPLDLLRRPKGTASPCSDCAAS